MLSRIFLRFLLLCGLTALLVAGLVAYVKWSQPQPAPGAPLTVAAERDILWPWEWGGGATLAVRFTPPPTEPEASPVRDLVLAIDTSGSMVGQPLESAKQAAVNFLDNMDLGRVGGKVAVIEFGEKANLMFPLGMDIGKARDTILTGLNIEPGADTLLIPALEAALKELESNRVMGATVLLLTDGQAADRDLRKFYEDRWRRQSHALFLLGAGDAVKRDSLEVLTDDPAIYVLTSVDKQSPQALFEEVAQRLRNQLGRAARLDAPWSAPLVEPAAAAAQPGCEALPAGNRYDLPPLFARERAYCWTAAFRPRLGGILPVLHRPASLEYIDKQGRLQTLDAQPASPRVLALSWWLLLPLLLYPLGEGLAHLLAPRPRPPTALPPPPRAMPLPPPLLPRREVDPSLRAEWIPTLVIGLGGGGRQVLTHIAQALRDACQEPGAGPSLLALDVARQEPLAVQGCLEPLTANAVFFLPEDACRLQAQVGRQSDPDAPAAALDLSPYRDWTAPQLGLGQGTEGQGPLARLALLNDLAAGADSGLLNRLRSALEAWRQAGGASTRRQLLLVGNTEGGITRGWLADLLLLLRRLVADDERAGVAVDISVLLLGQPQTGDGRHHPLDTGASALFDELDRLACAGRLPFRHGWGGGCAILADDWERRRPQDALFVMAARREDWERQLYPNAADALLLLADSHRRLNLAGMLESLGAQEAGRRTAEGKESFTEIDLRSAAFPHAFRHRQIELGLLKRLLGACVLSPGLNAEATELPADPAATLVDGPSQTGAATLDTLLALASGQIAAKPGKPPEDAQRALLARLQAEWTERLRTGRWNLATLARCADRAAKNLRGGNADLAAQALEELAEQAVEWTSLLLGTATAKRLAETAGLPGPTAERPGMLAETDAASQSVAQRYAEWRANPTRLAVPPWQGDGGSLLDAWLPSWLGPVSDLDLELRRRCHFELALTGPGSAVLALAFTGTAAGRFGPGNLPQFVEALRREIDQSLWPDTRRRFLESLGEQADGDPVQAAADFARRIKAELRSNQATLLVSLPGREAAPGELAGRVRSALRDALEQSAGPGEILRFHEAGDPFRFLLWRLQPLKQSRPCADNPANPVHFCERRRADYGRALAGELGLVRLRLPAAAGLALADSGRLTTFAGLWLAGHIQRDAATGLWQCHQPPASSLRLGFFPEEGLAEAAARFVACDHGAALPGHVPERRPDPAADPFENLLCWLWQHRSRTQADHK